MVADPSTIAASTSLPKWPCRPRRGHDLVKTSEDPSGTKPVGTHTNCSGGVTPWGTILTCEEWVYYDFGGDPAKTDQEESLTRYGYSGHDGLSLARYHARFDVEQEPNEMNRFHWVVEFDPYDPQSVPVKRTALGRFGHEGAQTAVSPEDVWSSIRGMTPASNTSSVSFRATRLT